MKRGMYQRTRSLFAVTRLGKLVDVCMVVVADSGQFVLEGFFVQGQAFAQFRQGGIGIPQLGIDVTDEDHGIFWNIHWKPPC